MRRTFITLARTDGAIDSLLRWITHGPTSDMLDVYSSPPWSALCAEAAKLKIELREGTLVPMPNSGASRWQRPKISADWPRAGLRRGRQPRQPSQAAVATSRFSATPTGFEPVLPA